jgi:DNA-directed RNA polymerase specialized sigma24 family protein
MSAPTGNFAATRWTLVLAAQGGDSASRAALSELCATYYAPVVTFLRASGRAEDAARELAHTFFAGVLAGDGLRGADPARGRFRSYLLGALKHFLASAWDREQAAKRGGGVPPSSLDDPGTNGGAAAQIAAPDVAHLEWAFDRQWALTIIARALAAIGEELQSAGKAAHFETLKPWLTGAATGLSQADAALALGVSESAAKVAIHRLRQRFRETVKREIAQTVPADADVDDELRHLLAVLVARDSG